jgi:hypothetical protein
VNNDINITSVRAIVTRTGPDSNIGEGTIDISSLIKTTPLAFKELITVDSFVGMNDVQVGRLATFT